MTRKYARKRKGKPGCAGILLLVVFVAVVFLLVILLSIFTQGFPGILTEHDGEEVSGYLSSGGGDVSNPGNKVTTTFPAPKAAHESTASVKADKLNSPHAILIRSSDAVILFQKNSEDRIYPASLTKIMTAIVAIENIPDLEKGIELSDALYQKLYEADASMAGFLPGEKVRALDLLYGAMLPSGAECCIGLAEKIAGAEKDYVAMMNQKALELGMESTHFENATGLHDENHYTSVKDLSLLLRYALENELFREIFTASRHSTPPTNKHPDGITFSSTLFDELKDTKLTDGKILGGKTGYTAEAGQCLASLAEVGGQEYMMITAGANGDHQSEQYHVVDAVAVYNSISIK